MGGILGFPPLAFYKKSKGKARTGLLFHYDLHGIASSLLAMTRGGENGVRRGRNFFGKTKFFHRFTSLFFLTIVNQKYIIGLQLIFT
jgi:hypothetical protein